MIETPWERLREIYVLACDLRVLVFSLEDYLHGDPALFRDLVTLAELDAHYRRLADEGRGDVEETFQEKLRLALRNRV